MSFSDNQKNEIINHQYKSVCCRRALLSGVLFAKGIFDGRSITISLGNDKICDFVSSLIGENFGKEPQFFNSRTGGRRKMLTFYSPAAIKYLTRLESGDGEYFTSKCGFCKSSFLRGIFLASGTVSDPDKQYRLDLAPSVRARMLSEYLQNDGIFLSERNDKGVTRLYTNKSSEIEDFFASLGLNSTMFTFMNKKIEGDLKNSVNRVRNCETNNIEKSVLASARQSEAIEALQKANMLSTLPEELEKTARLRLQFRDYSLARLAAEFTPPISKPGLSHRLNKIVEIADRLVSDDGED